MKKNNNLLRILSLVMSVILITTIFMRPTLEVEAATDYSAVFNVTYYKTHNPDLAAAGITSDKALLNHFINSGMKEGRQGNEEFNVYAYKNRYADLQTSFGNDLKKYYLHYINSGKAEGRNGRPDGTTPTNPSKPSTPSTTPTSFVTNYSLSTATAPYVENNGVSYLTMTPGTKVTRTETYDKPLYTTRGNETIQIGTTKATRTVTETSGSGHTAEEIAKANYNPSGLTSGYSVLTGSAKIGDRRVLCYSQGCTYPTRLNPGYYLMECYAITANGVPLFRVVGSADNAYNSTNASITRFVNKVMPNWSIDKFTQEVYYSVNGEGCMGTTSASRDACRMFLVESYAFISDNHYENFVFNSATGKFYANHTLLQLDYNGFISYWKSYFNYNVLGYKYF